MEGVITHKRRRKANRTALERVTHKTRGKGGKAALEEVITYKTKEMVYSATVESIVISGLSSGNGLLDKV